MKLIDMIVEHKINPEEKERYLTMLKGLHDAIASDSEFVINGNSFRTSLNNIRSNVEFLNYHAKPSDYIEAQNEQIRQKKEADKIEAELLKNRREGDKSLAKSDDYFGNFKAEQKKLGRITEPGLSQVRKQFIATTSANVELLMPNGALLRFYILDMSKNPHYGSTNMTGAMTFTKLAHYARQLRDVNSPERKAYGPMAKSIDKLISAGYKMNWDTEKTPRYGYEEWPEIGQIKGAKESYKLKFDADTFKGLGRADEWPDKNNFIIKRSISFSPSGSIMFYDGDNMLSFTVEQIFEVKRINDIINNVRAVKKDYGHRKNYGEYGTVMLAARDGQGIHPIGTEYIGANLRFNGEDVQLDSSEIYGEGDLIKLLMRDDV